MCFERDEEFFCQAEIQRFIATAPGIQLHILFLKNMKSHWTQFNLNEEAVRDDVETLLGMAEPGRVQSRLSTVLIYLSKSCYNTTTTATRQQQQRLHTSRMRSFSFQLGLCDVLCKFQHHLASTRHTDTDDTLTPPLQYLAIYFILFF